MLLFQIALLITTITGHFSMFYYYFLLNESDSILFSVFENLVFSLSYCMNSLYDINIISVNMEVNSFLIYCFLLSNLY